MARGKASGATKAQGVLARLAAEQGAELNLGALLDLKSQNRAPDTYVKEEETVLRVLHRPHNFMMKKCKRCKEPFGTNFCAVAYCSDTCIAADLASLGIKYDPFKDRWRHTVSKADNLTYSYEPPEIISTQTLLELKEFAEKFLADFDRLKDQALQQSLENLGASGEGPQDHEQPEPVALAERQSVPVNTESPKGTRDGVPLTTPVEALLGLEAVEDYFA